MTAVSRKHIRRWFPAILAILGSVFCQLYQAAPLAAQNDSLRLNQQFLFADGLYLDWPSVRQNRPDLKWEDVEATLAVNPVTLLARVERFRLRESGEELPPDSIRAFARDSFLFLRLDREPLPGGALLYAGLWEQGRICLYSYETDVTRMVEIKAYNPQTGRPFRSARVPRSERVEVIEMVDFHSGARNRLNRANLLAAIRGDQALHERIAGLPSEDLDLPRVVGAFNQRHPVYLPTPK